MTRLLMVDESGAIMQEYGEITAEVLKVVIPGETDITDCPDHGSQLGHDGACPACDNATGDPYYWRYYPQ